MTDHAELARLAEAATHKNWAAFTDDSGGRPHTNLVSFDPITDCALSISGAHKNDPNVAFIAAANPATVLAILSEIAALRVRAEEADALASKHFVALREKQDDAAILKHGKLEAERQRDELRKALEGALPQLEVLHSIISGKETRAVVWREITKGRQALANQGADQ